MLKTSSPINTFLWVLAVSIALAPFAQAGEIYGRVVKNGKVYVGATVNIQCGGYSKSPKTNQTGAYRSPGPKGEQQCNISVSGAHNAVRVITSRGRTRVNLEVRGNRLLRR